MQRHRQADTDLKAIDDLTVEITLAAANADLPTILALHHFMIVADGTTDFSKGNGTGAFISKSSSPASAPSAQEQNYWKAGGPHVDTFEFFAINEDNARVNALLSGDIHLAASINPRSVRLVESQPGFVLSRSSSDNYTNLNVRLDMAPGQNKDFVTGIKHLINREQILKSALRGFREIGNDQPVFPANIYATPISGRSRTIRESEISLQKAGVFGQSVPVVASEAAKFVDRYGDAAPGAGSAIGMKLDIQRVPSDGYWDNYWLKAPVHFGNINPRPTPDICSRCSTRRRRRGTKASTSPKSSTSMLIEARGTLDQAKRKEIYGQMQAMIAEEAGTVIPAYISNVDATHSQAEGPGAKSARRQMGYALAEYVWLEA